MAADKDNLFKRGNYYYLRQRINGKLIHTSLKIKSLVDARNKRDEILKSANDVKIESDVVHKTARAKNLYNPKRLKLDCIVKIFESHPALEKPSVQTMKYYKNWISSFISWLKNYYPSEQCLSDIDVDISREYSKYLYSTGISHKTFNEQINTLARVFELFKEEGGISRNPFGKDIIARLNKNAVSRKEFSKEEVNTILNSFPEIQNIPNINEYELLFLLGIYTGARLKDSCLLKWEDVNLTRKLIAITPYKTLRYGTKIQIPISQWLIPKLIEFKANYTSEYVMPNLAYAYQNARHTVNKNIQRILKYNGFENAETKGIQRRQIACSYGYHSLRYSFVSFCAEAGIPMALIQDIVGHLNPAMTKHYTRFSNEFKQKALSSLQISIDAPNTADLRKKLLKRIETASESELAVVAKTLSCF